MRYLSICMFLCLFLFFIHFSFILYVFYIFPLFLFFACNSAFEQGYLEPWRYINALLLLLLLFAQGHSDSFCTHIKLSYQCIALSIYLFTLSSHVIIINQFVVIQ